MAVVTLALAFAEAPDGAAPAVRPLIRLLAGSGIEAMPRAAVTSIYPDGRYEGPESKGTRTPEEVHALRLKLSGLASVRQVSLEKEIALSGLPGPPMRNDSVLYGLEIDAPRARRHLYLRSPDYYRGKGLPRVDAFLRVLDEVARFGAVQLRG